MPTVQKLGDDGSTARRPGTGAVYLNKRRGHHVVFLQLSKHIFTGLHVVMWHVEHMAC